MFGMVAKGIDQAIATTDGGFMEAGNEFEQENDQKDIPDEKEWDEDDSSSMID